MNTIKGFVEGGFRRGPPAAELLRPTTSASPSASAHHEACKRCPKGFWHRHRALEA
jgi:hypothetical protein